MSFILGLQFNYTPMSINNAFGTLIIKEFIPNKSIELRMPIYISKESYDLSSRNYITEIYFKILNKEPTLTLYDTYFSDTALNMLNKNIIDNGYDCIKSFDINSVGNSSGIDFTSAINITE